MGPRGKDEPAPPRDADDLEALERLGPMEGALPDLHTRNAPGPLISEPPAPRELGPTLASTRIGPLPASVVANLEFDDAAGAPCRLAKTVTVIGRVASGADLVLPWNDEVSREHAAILYTGEGFFLEDLQSKNGTFVNERRVERVALRSGDRVRIGGQVLVFRLSG